MQGKVDKEGFVERRWTLPKLPTKAFPPLRPAKQLREERDKFELLLEIFAMFRGCGHFQLDCASDFWELSLNRNCNEFQKKV